MPCSEIGIFILNAIIDISLIKITLDEVQKMDRRELELKSGRWVMRLLLSSR